MAKVHGDKFRTIRKSKKLTQTELAAGICKQATISNLEKKNQISNISILSRLCDKLAINISEILIESTEQVIFQKLDEVERLCTISNDKAAKTIIDTIRVEDLLNCPIPLKGKYYYYAGITKLLVDEETDTAIFYFTKVIELLEKHDEYTIFAKMGLAMAYELKKDNEIAKDYYRESIAAAKQNSHPTLSFAKLYYNAAKFYSSQHLYQEAISTSELGIHINQKFQSTKRLEYLLYEKGYNLKAAGDPLAEKYYDYAKTVACFNHNEHILKVIDNELKK